MIIDLTATREARAQGRNYECPGCGSAWFDAPVCLDYRDGTWVVSGYAPPLKCRDCGRECSP